MWNVIPKVAMLELLVAWSGGPAGREERDNWEAGRMLTSAPVSMRRRRLLVQSVAKTGDSGDILWHSSPLVAGRLVSLEGAGLAALAGLEESNLIDGTSNKERGWLNMMWIARIDTRRSGTGAGVWENPGREVRWRELQGGKQAGQGVGQLADFIRRRAGGGDRCDCRQAGDLYLFCWPSPLAE